MSPFSLPVALRGYGRELAHVHGHHRDLVIGLDSRLYFKKIDVITYIAVISAMQTFKVNLKHYIALFANWS